MTTEQADVRLSDEMSGPDAVLAALDPEQREVVLAVRGPVCVVAGAGTGKTRAVAHRIAYACASGLIRPDRVLAVTFTTRAAGELRSRLRQLARSVAPGAGLEQVQARTFHAAALRQLTHFWPVTVGGRPPAVLESKLSLLAEAAKRARLRIEPAELRDAAAEIEWAKVTQVRPADYPAASAQADRGCPLSPSGSPGCSPPTRSCGPSGMWWTSSRCWSSPRRSWPAIPPWPRRCAIGTGTSSWTSTRTSTRCSSCCSTSGSATGATCAS